VLVLCMWLCVWARVSHLASGYALVLASVGMGGLYLLLLASRPTRITRGGWLAMVVLAVLMRLPWFFVPASGGEDHCRYLWDGAVAAQGLNPYEHAPGDVAAGKVDDPILVQLAQRGRGTLEGINHPHLRTIYPPVAQGAFALAHWIAPFDLTAWRAVLLAFDGLAALAVLGLLRARAASLSLMFVYLWNPLLVTESYGSCHVDLLAAAMVAAFAWALVARKPVAAAVILALAIGVKLWPVVLLPFLLRAAWGRWRRVAVTMAALAASLAAIAVAFVGAFGAGADSGLLTYARTWSGRAGAYEILGTAGWWLRSRFSIGIDGHYVGRGLMLLLFLPAAMRLGLARSDEADSLCRRAGLTILLLLLLGPVLWPWYYLPIIPLAAVASGRLGLLLWTALLPLCYLEATGPVAGYLPWLVHAPVWLLLAVEWARHRLARRLDAEAVHV
jgi:hypothetical protein